MGLNATLDRLPRTRVGRAAREAPAFRACGVAGFYAALVALFGGGLLAGRSLLVLALLAAVCGLSFFVYALARRQLTGRENLVLLEHVWFAEACSAGVLAALGLPVLGYLDVLAPALALFLAGGRVGCLLVGCCHGQPSSLGIVYGSEAVRDGFPAPLAGVRLFPVPAVEAAWLVVVAATGLAALPYARPGGVLTWFLAAYSVVRFGLEGLRGDRRPHALGLSVNRWMCLVELGFALWLSQREQPVGTAGVAAAAALGALLLATLVVLRARDPRPALLRSAHLDELRAVARAPGPPLAPAVRATAGGVTVAATEAEGGAAHVSLALPGRRDLPLLCELAAEALPELDPAEAQATEGGVLHVLVPLPLADAPEPRPERRLELYGAVARRLQQPPPAPAPTLLDSRRSYFGS